MASINPVITEFRYFPLIYLALNLCFLANCVAGRAAGTVFTGRNLFFIVFSRSKIASNYYLKYFTIITTSRYITDRYNSPELNYFMHILQCA